MQRRTYVFVIAEIVLIVAFVALLLTPTSEIPLGLSRRHAEAIVGGLIFVSILADALINRFWGIKGAITRRDRNPVSYWVLAAVVAGLMINYILARVESS